MAARDRTVRAFCARGTFGSTTAPRRPLRAENASRSKEEVAPDLADFVEGATLTTAFVDIPIAAWFAPRSRN